MPCKRARALKVVVIETQFVRTDTMNFKSVVQQLTGKDAVVLSAAADELAVKLPWETRDEMEGGEDEKGGRRCQEKYAAIPSVEAKEEGCDFSGMSVEEFCSLWDCFVK